MTSAKPNSPCNYVYVLFRETALPFYVGKGHGDRWKYHVARVRKGKTGKNSYKDNIIRNMLDKGLEVPCVFIRSNLSEAEANEIEIAFIKAIGRHPNGPLVNLTDGGDGRVGAKLSDAHKAAFKLTHHSEESKQRMSESAKNRPVHPSGWKWTETQRAVITAAARGNQNCLGRKLSEETLTKMSNSAKERGISRATQEAAWNATRGKKLTKEEIAERRFVENAQLRKRNDRGQFV